MTRHRQILGACVLASTLLNGCGEREVVISPDAHIRLVDMREGIGMKAENGMLVHVHYTGALPDGTVVVSTYEKKRAHKFIVGEGSVIPGMDTGVVGMRSGGKRKIIMPPAAHYGRYGYADTIPPETVLTFIVEMVRVQRPDGVSGGELHPSDPRRRHAGQRSY